MEEKDLVDTTETAVGRRARARRGGSERLCGCGVR